MVPDIRRAVQRLVVWREAASKTHPSLGIGMIGCGEIAYRATGKAIQAAQNTEIVIAMDPLQGVAQSFGQKFEVPWTTELDEVLQNPAVDAVVISTPHYTHEPVAVQAAAAGKHVICEKPIACTVDQADRMIEACNKATVLFSVCMVGRYDPATVIAKQLVDQGGIGRVIGLQFHFMVRKPDSYWLGGFTGRVTSDWRQSRERSGGGVLMMNMVHEIDLGSQPAPLGYPWFSPKRYRLARMTYCVHPVRGS